MSVKSVKRYIARFVSLLPLAAGLLAALAFCLVCRTFIGEGSFYAGCRAVCADTLRLHIRAASDTAEDQALKLLVRDALVEETAALAGDAAGKSDAETILRENLPALAHTAREALRQAGCGDPVSVRLGQAWFNTRRYSTAAGELTLPAGRYDALTVTIGEGEGHNWWCVLYPSLCLPAASEGSLSLYTDAEQAVVREGYTVRFWLVEAFSRLAAWLAGEEMAVR